MFIYPAIDIMEGCAVRLVQGRFADPTVYPETPLEIAKRYEDAGLSRLHLVDLDGARNRTIINYKTIEAIASRTNLQIDFGGGVQSEQDIALAFECGAAQVNIGTAAVREQSRFCEWLHRFGASRIILAADVRSGKIVMSGWEENCEISANDFVKYWLERGVEIVSCTSVENDGTMKGPAITLYQQLCGCFPEAKLIASGGVAALSDLEKLSSLSLYGVIIGRALLEGKISASVVGAIQC